MRQMIIIIKKRIINHIETYKPQEMSGKSDCGKGLPPLSYSLDVFNSFQTESAKGDWMFGLPLIGANYCEKLYLSGTIIMANTIRNKLYVYGHCIYFI